MFTDSAMAECLKLENIKRKPPGANQRRPKSRYSTYIVAIFAGVSIFLDHLQNPLLCIMSEKTGGIKMEDKLHA